MESNCIIKPWAEMTNHQGSHNVSFQSLHFFPTSTSPVQSSRVNCGILSLIANASSTSDSKSQKYQINNEKKADGKYDGRIIELSMSQALKWWSKWYMNCYVRLKPRKNSKLWSLIKLVAILPCSDSLGSRWQASESAFKRSSWEKSLVGNVDKLFSSYLCWSVWHRTCQILRSKLQMFYLS